MRDISVTVSRHDGRSAWLAYAAAGWSLGYGLLGLHWARGGAGFPFGRERDPDADAAESILAGTRARSFAPLVAAFGPIGAPLALAMARSRGNGVARHAVLAIAGSIAGTLLVVIPDRRLILLAAYAPIALLRGRFDWQLAGSAHHPTGATLVFHDGALPWPVSNQLLLVAGGLLWGATTIAYANHGDTESSWTRPETAARWGRWAVAVAVAVPLVFAATRWAWALGFPLGIDKAFFLEGQQSGLWRVGGALATVTVTGAALTLGLSQRWGEIFPGWMIGLAGKRVPPALAIGPATLAAIAVTSAGLGYVRAFLRAGIPEEGWAMIVPEFLWPVWGVALGAATLAYYFRRRREPS